MWHENLIELFKEYEKKGGNKHTLAEKANLPYDTVKRVLSGKTPNPTLDTLDRLATALDCSLGDILVGTRAIIGTQTLAEVQEKLDTVTAGKQLVLAQNEILKEKNAALEKEVELLKMQMAYKDELIAVHNIYLNFIKNQDGKNG